MTAAATELLLRVQIAGVVDRDAALSGSVDERTISELVAQDALADDGGSLYVTENGDQLLTRLLRADPDHEAALLPFFDEFSVLDLELKAALTAWQRAQREDDQDGQLTAVESWLDVDSRLSDAATDAVRAVVGRYLDQLHAAREAVLDGKTDQLSGTDDTSYHSSWFVLHEVLIRSLGRSRGDGAS
ncbi:MAG TPA: hypothetical protein VFE65_31715 [Pseudonocardia sp.]|jgi:hypothetical protein|nr:hypothetical protein [Pseudonocardia sp.]